MITRFVRLALAGACAALMLLPRAAAAQAPPLARLVFPADRAVVADARVQFSWTGVAEAQAYYLYVGSTQGGSDVVNSREIQQTIYTATNLPGNVRLCVRLWTKLAGRWAYVDSSLSVAPLKATMATPADGATNVSILQPLQWTAVQSAEAYELWIGTAAGAADVLSTPETSATSWTPLRLPANQQLFARLWTKLGGVWRYADSRFSTAPTAALIAPANGGSEVDLGQSAIWTAVANAQAYYLYVGTAPGARDVVDSGELQQTSYASGPWPGGRLLFARLWTKFGGQWRFEDSSFTTEPAASMLSPAPNATAVPLAQTFVWKPLAQAQSYRLFVGSTPGANDVIDTNEVTSTSYQPRVLLPTARTLYIRLWTKCGNKWRAVDSQFSTAPVATLATPVDGARNVPPNPVFAWTPVSGAQSYVLYVGTAPGASDVIKTIESTQTTVPSTALPANRTLYARLWTKAGGTWRYIDSSFTVAVLTATITSPAAGATSVSALDPIRWTSVPNADAYVLWIGTQPGDHDVFATPEIDDTLYYPMSMPSRRTLYARLWTSVGGTWRYSDTSFSVAPLTAELTNPQDGASQVDAAMPAMWTHVPEAQAHVLYIGSTPGDHDLLLSPETTQTSYPIASLRPGHVYARLWTRAAGVWRFVDSAFTIGSRTPQFLQPVDGALAVDPSQPFRWTPSLHGEAYRLTVGTAPGTDDVLDSGSLSGTTYSPAVALPHGALYARVYVMTGGAWTLHSDIRFTLDSTTRIAFIDAPRNRSQNFDAGSPFEWKAVPFAGAYRLSIGTARGVYDLHDSGPIHVTRRFVPDLPVGVPLFGRLQTEIDGHWYSTRFTFTVALNSPSISARLESAFWEADVVRRMSDLDSQPYGWTPLASRLRPTSDYVVCSDFAETLVTMLAEMNLGLPAVRRDIAFDTNGYEGHSLVNVFDPTTSRWLLVDPTFDLVVQRSDGQYATAEEVAQAVANFDWSAITFRWLGYESNPLPNFYYLDYPLLYLNVSQPLVPGKGRSPLPYLAETPLPAAGASDVFVVQCLVPGPVDVVVNGVRQTLTCDGIDSLTLAFSASRVSAPDLQDGPLFRLYRLRRYVF